MKDDNVEQDSHTRTAPVENRDYRDSRNPGERGDLLVVGFRRVRHLLESRRADTCGSLSPAQGSVAQTASVPGAAEMVIGVISVDRSGTDGVSLGVVGLDGPFEGVRSTLRAPKWMPVVKPGDRAVMETRKIRTPEGADVLQFTRCVRVERSTGEAHGADAPDPGAQS